MHDTKPIKTFLLIIMLMMTASGAWAFDETKYPNLKGQWVRIGSPRWVQDDPWNLKAPVTPEYKAIHAANLADMQAGGQGTDPTYMCLAPGMPRSMNAYAEMEVVVTAETTYILIDYIHDNRRIYTDGRGWPTDMEATFGGYSIGHWIDTKNDGHFDVLEVETRGFKGPRTFDESGLPLHEDNQTVVKERIYLDKADPDLLHDQITTIDNALLRPWTIVKDYRRDPSKYPIWREFVCMESNQHVRVGKDDFFLSSDGYLMPTRKGQAPPNLKYFDQPQNQQR
jgi:hypothetical protein